MKIHLITTYGCLAAGLCLLPPQSKAEFEVSAGFSIQAASDFYQPLSDEGVWMDIGSYGRCWRPAGVTMSWRPYCNGYWEWTDCGWYWVSDEPWAWACYHYGNWVYDSDYGWVWVPGVQWAPAWVYWRTGGDYIGWAPCAPSGVDIAPTAFVFVQSDHFHDRVRPDRVIVNNYNIINQTTVIRDIRRETRDIGGRQTTVIVNNGPRVEKVSEATGHHFTPVSVVKASQTTFHSAPESVRQRSSDTQFRTPSRQFQEQPQANPYRNQEQPRNYNEKPNQYNDRPRQYNDTPRQYNETPSQELPRKYNSIPRSQEAPTPPSQPYKREQNLPPPSREQMVPTPNREQNIPLPEQRQQSIPRPNREGMPQAPSGQTAPSERREVPQSMEPSPRAREFTPPPSAQPRQAPATPEGQPGMAPPKQNGQNNPDDRKRERQEQ
ncbi:MAG TPA: DUF6600 domain-containing protein [Verrucomicrobiae bacterium]